MWGCFYFMSKKHYFLILVLIGQIFLNGSVAYSQEKKIISLGPAFTKAIYELDAQDNLIGCTSFCPLQDDADKKEIVATIIDVNIEKIIELNPDIILASKLTNRRSIELLSKAGFSVVVFDQPKNFNQLCDQFRKIAQITATEEKAEKIINQVKEAISQIQAETINLYRPKVFIQIGARPLFTVTSDSFINDMIDKANAINIAREAKIGLYSTEEVLAKKPDHIIISTMGLIGEQEKMNWQKYQIIPAVKNKKIDIIDQDALCSPTPSEFAKTLKILSKIIHNGKKNEL